MVRQKIVDSIKLNTEIEIKKINKETEEIIRKIKASRNLDNKLNYEKQLKLLTEKQNLRVNNKEQELEILKTEFIEDKKMQIIETIFEKVYEKILSSSKSDLEKLVLKLLKDANISIDNTIIVAKHNLKKYSEIFAKYDNTLIEAKDSIEFEGFMIETQNIDYIFNFKEIIKQIKKEKQLKIYEELYKNE